MIWWFALISDVSKGNIEILYLIARVFCLHTHLGLIFWEIATKNH